MKKTPDIAYNSISWISASSEVRPAVNGNWQARRELATALRRLNCAALTSDVPTELLQSVTATLQAEAARFEAGKRLFGNRAQTGHIAALQGQTPDMSYEMHPVIGQCNAVALPMHIWQADGRIHASVTPGWAYEGPFEHLHGGNIAMLFDILAGFTAILTGSSGRTGTLTIRYHHLTPLNKPLRLVADLKRVEGRKQFMAGELWADDLCTASCEAVLIAAKKNQMPSFPAIRTGQFCKLPADP